jgi:hypothetical protein
MSSDERLYGWPQPCAECSQTIYLDGRPGNEVHRVQIELPDRRSGLAKAFTKHQPDFRTQIVCPACLERLLANGWRRIGTYRRYKSESGLC